jgi:hypothetical protein
LSGSSLSIISYCFNLINDLHITFTPTNQSLISLVFFHIVTRPVAVPKTMIVKQEPQQQVAPNDTERTDFTPIRPQPPLPNQRNQ